MPAPPTARKLGRQALLDDRRQDELRRSFIKSIGRDPDALLCPVPPSKPEPIALAPIVASAVTRPTGEPPEAPPPASGAPQARAAEVPPVESDGPPMFFDETDDLEESTEFDDIFGAEQPADDPPQTCNNPATEHATNLQRTRDKLATNPRQTCDEPATDSQLTRDSLAMHSQKTREPFAKDSRTIRERLATAPPPEIDLFAVTSDRPTIPSTMGPAKKLLTRDERENVVALVAGGTRIQVACKALRISTRTFWNTMHADAEFARTCRDARLEPDQSVDRALLGLALGGNMQAMVDYLAHCRAKRREKLDLELQKLATGGAGGTNPPDMSKLSEEQRIQLRDLLRAVGFSKFPPAGT
jgi:hypothetical protein